MRALILIEDKPDGAVEVTFAHDQELKDGQAPRSPAAELLARLWGTIVWGDPPPSKDGESNA